MTPIELFGGVVQSRRGAIVDCLIEAFAERPATRLCIVSLVRIDPTLRYGDDSDKKDRRTNYEATKLAISRADEQRTASTRLSQTGTQPSSTIDERS